MPTNYAALPYQMGSPGMVATANYQRSRQQVNDEFWVNKSSTKKLYYGTVALRKANKLESPEGTAGFAGEVLGVYMDPIKFRDRNYYIYQESVSVLSSGDIWVLVPPAIVINTGDNVSYLETNTTINSTAIPGVFTNATPAAGIIAMPGAKFLTPNCGGIAVIGLDSWKGN